MTGISQALGFVETVGLSAATEAADAVVQHGFGALDLHRIDAHHMSRNPPSGRVMQKIGMHHEGRAREHVLKNGVFEDLESEIAVTISARMPDALGVDLIDRGANGLDLVGRQEAADDRVAVRPEVGDVLGVHLAG